MKAVYANGVIFSKIFLALAEVFEFSNLEFREQGVSLCALDSANVCLVYLVLRADGFDRYECDKPFQVGIQMESIASVVRCVREKSTVELQCTEDSDSITFVFRSICSRKVFRFSQFLMTIDADNFHVPKFTKTCSFQIPSSELKKICTSLSAFGDVMVILVKAEKVIFTVAGSVGLGSISIQKPLFPGVGRYGDVKIHCPDETCQKISIAALKRIIKATPLANVVTIKMSLEGPVLFTYKIADLGFLRYYLAPQM